MDPVTDYASLALARARKAADGVEFPETLRHVVGLREGWEAALAAANQPRDATDQQ